MLKVRETIHHGDFFNVRDFEMKPTWNGFVELLATSPYPADIGAADNRYTAKTFADLISKGKAEIGWASLQVI